MISQDQIDTVLQDAERAVDTLADDVGRLAEGTAVARPDANQPADQDTAPQPAASPAAHQLPARWRRLLNLRVTVSVEVASRRIPLSEILKIMPGTILEFERSVDEDLDLMIGRHRIGRGVAVKLHERFGLRITGIGDVRDRLASMTG